MASAAAGVCWQKQQQLRGGCTLRQGMQLNLGTEGGGGEGDGVRRRQGRMVEHIRPSLSLGGLIYGLRVGGAAAAGTCEVAWTGVVAAAGEGSCGSMGCSA